MLTPIYLDMKDILIYYHKLGQNIYVQNIYGK